MIGTTLIKVALKTLGHPRWNWRSLDGWGFIRRNNVAARSAAVVAHDRIICGDILSRGTPSFYGQKR